MPHLTKDDIKELLKAKQEGESDINLAKMFGVSRATINAWCNKLRKEGYKVPKVKPTGRKAMNLKNLI